MHCLYAQRTPRVTNASLMPNNACAINWNRSYRGQGMRTSLTGLLRIMDYWDWGWLGISDNAMRHDTAWYVTSANSQSALIAWSRHTDAGQDSRRINNDNLVTSVRQGVDTQYSGNMIRRDDPHPSTHARTTIHITPHQTASNDAALLVRLLANRNDF